MSDELLTTQPSTEARVRPKKEKHRIPYDVWSNSQLSIAKYYGGAIIQGKTYVLDYKNCRTTGEGDDKKFFPDLVEK